MVPTRAMFAGVTENSPARLAEPASTASKIAISQTDIGPTGIGHADIGQADIGQAWSFAPTRRFPRMRSVLRLFVDGWSIRPGRRSFERNRTYVPILSKGKAAVFSLPIAP